MFTGKLLCVILRTTCRLAKKTKENCNMSDLYSELLVKKERTAKDRLVKGSIIALIEMCIRDRISAVHLYR